MQAPSASVAEELGLRLIAGRERGRGPPEPRPPTPPQGPQIAFAPGRRLGQAHRGRWRQPLHKKRPRHAITWLRPLAGQNPK